MRAALKKVRENIAEGLLPAGASDGQNATQPQYQCGAAQYHDGSCAGEAHAAVSRTEALTTRGVGRPRARIDLASTLVPPLESGTPSNGDADAGWQLVRSVVDDPSAEAPTEPAVAHLGQPQRVGSVSAVVVQRTQAPTAVNARPLPRGTAPPSQRAADVRPLRAAAADSASGDWFLRSLIVLFGIAAVALFLAALSGLDGVGPTVTLLRSRIGSRGLSATRIALGAREQPRGGIRYRE